MKQFSSKLNTGFIVILVILVLALLGMIGYKNYKTTTILNNFEDTITDQDYDELAKQVQQQQAEGLEKNNSDEVKSETYLYKNHGIELELPKRAVSSETKIKDAPIIIIVFEDEELHTTNPLKVVYATDAQWFIQNELRHFNNTGTEKIGTITFNRYTTNTDLGVINSYWYQQGNIGYLLEGDSEILKTFKFVGWK